MARLLEYDPLRRRLWIAGQRCHHGATGSLVAAAACAGLIAPGSLRIQTPSVGGPRSLLALALAGGALMAHDWKDHAVWFKRGQGERDY